MKRFFGKFNSFIPQSLKNSLYHLPKAFAALALNGFPSRGLTIIGVTGSDGKTTTSHLIYHLLTKSGIKTALISTVSAQIGEEKIDTGFHVTSPNPFLLQRLLRVIKEKGFTHVVLEATSHGLDQHRFLGINFKVGVLTNITHEHLDYHKTKNAYIKAKSKLFVKSNWAILNKDDKNFQLTKAYIPRSTRIISFGLAGDSVVKAANISIRKHTSSFTISWGKSRIRVSLPLPGRYNIQNALAALATLGVLGIKLEDSVKYLSDFKPILGRLNLVSTNPDIYIDFAHTPNALEQVLSLIKSQLQPGCRLISVFGCAGERDREKRPMMGRIAAKLADISIFTAEDPRSESASAIINQIVSGAIKAKAKEIHSRTIVFKSRETPSGASSKREDFKEHLFIREPDRPKAIDLAIKLASPEDTILITGKGHEKSMNYGQGEVGWSDFDAVKSSLKQ